MTAKTRPSYFLWSRARKKDAGESYVSEVEGRTGFLHGARSGGKKPPGGLFSLVGVQGGALLSPRPLVSYPWASLYRPLDQPEVPA